MSERGTGIEADIQEFVEISRRQFDTCACRVGERCTRCLRAKDFLDRFVGKIFKSEQEQVDAYMQWAFGKGLKS